MLDKNSLSSDLFVWRQMPDTYVWMAWVMLKQKINELLDNETCYCVSLTSQFFFIYFFVCVCVCVCKKRGGKRLTIHQLSTGSTGSPGAFSQRKTSLQKHRGRNKKKNWKAVCFTFLQCNCPSRRYPRDGCLSGFPLICLPNFTYSSTDEKKKRER